jgi:hypothetical protein
MLFTRTACTHDTSFAELLAAIQTAQQQHEQDQLLCSAHTQRYELTKY